MTILILGANGQVGHELLSALQPLGDVIGATRSGLLADGSTCACVDLADGAGLSAALDALAPRIIVNAAAYTAVDRAETEPELAERINHRAVAELAVWARAHDVLVVHYSTDYVFDGSATRPYHEEDPVAPLGSYGRSKLAGEQALRASGVAHFIFRTAWVYGPRGGNFLLTMLRVGAQRDELRIVDDQIGTPTTAALIARQTAAVLRQWMAMSAADRGSAQGTYHLTTSQPCSWFDFASAIFDEARKAGMIERVPMLTPIPSSEYPTPARRPAWSVLDNSKLTLAFGLGAPPWRDGLREVVAQLRR